MTAAQTKAQASYDQQHALSPQNSCMPCVTYPVQGMTYPVPVLLACKSRPQPPPPSAGGKCFPNNHAHEERRLLLQLIQTRQARQSASWTAGGHACHLGCISRHCPWLAHRLALRTLQCRMQSRAHAVRWAAVRWAANLCFAGSDNRCATCLGMSPQLPRHSSHITMPQNLHPRAHASPKNPAIQTPNAEEHATLGRRPKGGTVHARQRQGPFTGWTAWRRPSAACLKQQRCAPQQDGCASSSERVRLGCIQVRPRNTERLRMPAAPTIRCGNCCVQDGAPEKKWPAKAATNELAQARGKEIDGRQTKTP